MSRLSDVEPWTYLRDSCRCSPVDQSIDSWNSLPSSGRPHSTATTPGASSNRTRSDA